MSVPPQGVGPRGTLPLGLGPVDSSPYASRHAERECRATACPPAPDPRALRQALELPESELPEWECFDRLDSEQESEPEPATVEPHRSAQGWGDVAPAPRAPRAPVRLRGHGFGPSFAPRAGSRAPGRVAAGALLTMLGAVAVVALAMTLHAPHERELRPELELHSAQRPTAPSTPEPAPPAVLTPRPASAPTSTALAASTARAARPATPAIPVTSDIVDPWRHK